MTGTILVVEDNEPTLEMMEIMLTRMGYTPVLVSDPEMALDFVDHEIPRLILLDIMMKPLSGWDVLKKIRASDRTRDIPVVVITAYPAADEEASHFSDAHLNILYKPVNIDDLKEALERSIARS